MFIEPMLLGRYPVDVFPLVEDVVQDGDMPTIRQPLDFYGVNYYNPMRIAATEEDAEMPFEFREVLGYDKTDFGWPVVPDALREWLIMLRARFRAALPPIMITESGCAYNMEPDENGVVDDQARIDYLESHLGAVSTAIQRGVDVRGYYALVADGQLRVGRGLHPAVRARARRLRDPGADPEAVLRLVRRPDRRAPAGLTTRLG